MQKELLRLGVRTLYLSATPFGDKLVEDGFKVLGDPVFEYIGNGTRDSEHGEIIRSFTKGVDESV